MYPKARSISSCSGVNGTGSDGVKSCLNARCASNCASRNVVYFSTRLGLNFYLAVILALAVAAASTWDREPTAKA